MTATDESSTRQDAGYAGVELAAYDNAWFSRGRPRLVELLWIVVQALFVASWLPGTFHRTILLRAFGARIGRGCRFKPGLRVKFPWRLKIGDHSWIGEAVWLDNLAEIEIGSNCCISQGAYLCTGSHDWANPTFALIVKPIQIADHAWIAAAATVGPGVSVGRGAVLALASAAYRNLDEWTVYQGTPAAAVYKRRISRRS